MKKNLVRVQVGVDPEEGIAYVHAILLVEKVSTVVVVFRDERGRILVAEAARTSSDFFEKAEYVTETAEFAVPGAIPARLLAKTGVLERRRFIA